MTTRSASASETLTVADLGAAETFVLAGRPQSGTVAGAFVITTPGFAGAVTNYEPVANRISVNTAAATADTRFSVTYPVRPARPPDVFAEVELELDRGLLQPPAAGPRIYLVQIAAASTGSFLFRRT